MAGMDGIGGGMDGKTFGAAVVSETLDRMNKDPNGDTDSGYEFQKSVLGAYAGVQGEQAMGSMADKQVMDKQTMGASVVSGTLDAMNTDPAGRSDDSYEFQKAVLGAFAEGGVIVDKKG